MTENDLVLYKGNLLSYSTYLYGFRKLYSTTLVLIKFTGSIIKFRDEGQYCVSIFVDLLILFIMKSYYRKTSHISRTLVGNKIVDNSDVVGASPVGAAPTTSSFST